MKRGIIVFLAVLFLADMVCEAKLLVNPEDRPPVRSLIRRQTAQDDSASANKTSARNTARTSTANDENDGQATTRSYRSPYRSRY